MAARLPRGFTLIEVLAALAIAALIALALARVLVTSTDATLETHNRNDLTQQARFAMNRMVASVRSTPALILPLPENPGTPHSESIRDPGVLAVKMSLGADRDGDGFTDADNDKDGQLDEDVHHDISDDLASGFVGIDDNGNGLVDEGTANDDDEDGVANEDPVNGLDDDGDGSVDEDPGQDMNGDNAPGVAGVDDDGDGFTDEGQNQDDDEDGSNNEDWLDPVVYLLSGTTLLERLPNLNPADGTDFTERPIAENVTTFRVERIPQGSGRAVLVDITLGLGDAGNEAITLNTRVRVGRGS